MRSLRRALLVVTLGSALVAAAPAGPATAGPATADPNGPTCPIQVQGGMTQPVSSFADAIEQRVWVQTPLDTDHDGRLDRVVADISRPRETETQGCKVPVIFEHSPYRSGVLGRTVRLSGRPELRLRASIDNRADANLSAHLVDYGPAGSTAFVVTRGWMDPQNRTGRDHTLAVKQGQMYDYRWTLEPKDYVFPAGHRIGLVVFSSDQEYTLLPLGGTRLTVAPAHSQLIVPVVGGQAALGL